MLLIGSLFNDIILYKGAFMLTLPKIILFPIIYLLLLYLMLKKQIHLSRLSISLFLTISGLIFFSIIFNKVFSNYSLSIIQSLLSGLAYMVVLSSIIICSNKKDTENHLNFGLKVIYVCTLFNALVGIFQSITGLGFISERKFLLAGTPFYRAQGLLLDPNYFGQLMLFGFFIVVFLYKKESKKIYFFSMPIVLLSIFLNGSRSTLLALILTFLIIILLDKSLKTLLSSMLSISTMYLILKVFLPNQLNYFLTIFNTSLYDRSAVRNSLQDRQLLLDQAIDVGIEYWYKGIGVGNFVLYNSKGMFSHNTLAEMFVEYGILGVIIFVIIFFLIPLKQYNGFKRSLNIHIRSYYLVSVAFISYSVMSFNLVSYYSKFSFLIFSIMIVLGNISLKEFKNEN